MKQRQRKLHQVPVYALLGMLILFAVQLSHHHWFKSSIIDSYKALRQPASADFYKAIALGSDRLWSYLLLLGVQLHDNQRGRHINYIHLNYETLQDWLLTLYELNPLSDYPAFLAARVYGQVPDKNKVRTMITVIETLFRRNPQQHWRRMTEACLLAKHQLQDLPLALKLAKDINTLPKTIKLPFWARDMELVLLDELNQFESAQLLISSMLQSGEIRDEDEIRFLKFRLLKIQQALLKYKQ